MGEYKVMTNIKAHVNVISVRGICYLKNSNEMYLLMEYCEFGSLERYLEDHLVNLITPGIKTDEEFFVHRKSHRHQRYWGMLIKRPEE